MSEGSPDPLDNGPKRVMRTDRQTVSDRDTAVPAATVSREVGQPRSSRRRYKTGRELRTQESDSAASRAAGTRGRERGRGNFDHCEGVGEGAVGSRSWGSNRRAQRYRAAGREGVGVPKGPWGVC